jgi:tetratricopeptide (TPR) repeat protein
MRAIAVSLALLLFSSVALADPKEDSRASFVAGVALAERADFRGAKEAFLKAHELFPHPSILLNLGVVRGRLGEYPEAERDLSRFLAEDGGASEEDIQRARAALADVRTHLGTVRVRVTPEAASIYVDDAPTPFRPGDLRLSAGTHALRVQAAGYQDARRTVELRAGDTASLEVALEAAAPAAARDDKSTRRTVGIVVLGASAAVGAFGTFSGLRALSLADAYNTPGDAHYRDASTRSEGETFRTLTDVAIVTAVVGAAMGLYFLVTSFGDDKPAKVGVVRF